MILVSIFDDIKVNKVIYILQTIFKWNLVLNFQFLTKKFEHFVHF